MISEKTCKRCDARKPINDFYRRSVSPDGFRHECKACVKEINAEQYAKNAEKRRTGQREYYHAHREQCRISAKRYHQANAESVKESRVRWQRTDGWATTLVCRARATARAKGYDFDLDVEFVRALYTKQSGCCYWLGVELQCVDEARNPFQPSLDRLDPEQGYTKANVVLASQFANMGRSEMSASRFAAFVSELELHFITRAFHKAA